MINNKITNTIVKVVELTRKKKLDKIFESPIDFKIDDIEVIEGKHYIVTISIPERYFQDELYSSKMDMWWEKLLRVREVISSLYPEVTLNFSPTISKE